MNNNNEFWFAGGLGGYAWTEHGQTVSPWHSLSSSYISFSEATGMDFGINGPNIMVQDGYISGAPISSSFLINGRFLEDINPQEGVILTLGNGDKIIVAVSASPVPLPAGIYLFLSGIVGLGSTRRIWNNK